MKRKKDHYLYKSKVIGDVIVPLIECEECQGCGKLTLSSNANSEVNKYVREQERRAIATLPVADLITAGQAAAILEVTRQAFSKNPKIKKGFVYFMIVGTKKAYFRTSIELFKATGDGRFPITAWSSSVPENSISIYSTREGAWQETPCQADSTIYSEHIWNKSLRAGL